MAQYNHENTKERKHERTNTRKREKNRNRATATFPASFSLLFFVLSFFRVFVICFGAFSFAEGEHCR